MFSHLLNCRHFQFERAIENLRPCGVAWQSFRILRPWPMCSTRSSLAGGVPLVRPPTGLFGVGFLVIVLTGDGGYQPALVHSIMDPVWGT